MKHVVAVMEVTVSGGESRAHPLIESFIRAGNREDAMEAAKEYVRTAHKNYKLRSISHATNGKILAYVVHIGPQKRKRFIQESVLRGNRR